MCRRVGKGESVADVAEAFGCGWHTAMNAVRDHGRPRVDDPDRTAGVTALGVDETSFLGAGPRRRTRFVTGLVDLDRSRLLDIVDGRAGSAVTGWLESRDEAWLSAVERVALDPYRAATTTRSWAVWTPPRWSSTASTSCGCATTRHVSGGG